MFASLVALLLFVPQHADAAACENEVRRAFTGCTNALKPWEQDDYLDAVGACLARYEADLPSCERDDALRGRWIEYRDDSMFDRRCEQIDAEFGGTAMIDRDDSRLVDWTVNGDRITRRYSYYFGRQNCSGQPGVVDSYRGTYRLDRSVTPARLVLRIDNVARLVRSDEAAAAMSANAVCGKADWEKRRYAPAEDIACRDVAPGPMEAFPRLAADTELTLRYRVDRVVNHGRLTFEAEGEAGEVLLEGDVAYGFK